MENIMSSPHSTLTATHPNPILFLFGVKDTSFLTPTHPPPPPPIIAVGHGKSYGARTLKMSTIFSLLRVASTATRKTFSARARNSKNETFALIIMRFSRKTTGGDEEMFPQEINILSQAYVPRRIVVPHHTIATVSRCRCWTTSRV